MSVYPAKREVPAGMTHGAEYVINFCKPGFIFPIERFWVSESFDFTYEKCLKYLNNLEWVPDEREWISLKDTYSERELIPLCSDLELVRSHTVHFQGQIHWVVIMLQFHVDGSQEVHRVKLEEKELTERARLWSISLFSFGTSYKEAVIFLGDKGLPIEYKQAVIRNAGTETVDALYRVFSDGKDLEYGLAAAICEAVWQNYEMTHRVIPMLRYLVESNRAEGELFASKLNDDVLSQCDPVIQDLVAQLKPKSPNLDIQE